MSGHAMQPERAAAMGAERPVITGARACAGCGYDLRGLREGDQCPECGRVIALDLVRKMGYLGEASRGYLYTMLLGFTLLSVGGVGVFLKIVQVAIPFLRGPSNSAGLIFFGTLFVLWFLGLTIVLRDRPEDLRRAEGDGERVPREHVWLRATILLMQWVWAGAVGLEALGMRPSLAGASGALATASTVLYLIGLIGLLPLSIYLAVVATWARDSGVAIRLQSVGWVMSLAGVSILVFLAIAQVTGWYFLANIAIMCAFIAWLGSSAVMAWTVFEMLNMVRWTLINKAGAESRDERRTARAMRERAEQQAHVAAAPPEPIPEPEETLLMDELLDPEPEPEADEPGRVWRSSAEHYIERRDDHDPYKIEGE